MVRINVNILDFRLFAPLYAITKTEQKVGFKITPKLGEEEVILRIFDETDTKRRRQKARVTMFEIVGLLGIERSRFRTHEQRLAVTTDRALNCAVSTSVKQSWAIYYAAAQGVLSDDAV